MIAAPKIVAKAASLDSALGFDQSGVEHHNITEENALPQHVVEQLVENILEQMESRERSRDGRSEE
jgi:pseudouridine-5'-phosphate glycosidase